MKFSPKKKAKMRKRNQRRINKVHAYMIGYHIDYERGYTVVDQAKIKNVMYLLAQSEDGKYAIYKIVKIFEYVRLSPKKVLYNQKEFSNCANWQERSMIKIAEDGSIESVEKEKRFAHSGKVRIFIWMDE